MASVLDSVNQRTQLVGQNRLELLLFRLRGNQKYGINVFKVREVLQCPKLTEIPKRDPMVRGVAYIRGSTLPIIDLNMAIGGGKLDNISNCFVIIAEYNRRVQGFLVQSVERIVNTNWQDIHPPPTGTGRNSYLTAVTEIDKQLVEIIDVEKVLSELVELEPEISEEVIEHDLKNEIDVSQLKILVADDSSVARNQVKRTIQQLGLQVTTCKDGKEALTLLENIVEEGGSIYDEFLMCISDIEMPEMDGYTLTAEVRNNSKMDKFYIVLHTSLSGVFNQAMVKKVGANEFIAKFNPNDLAKVVQEQIKQRKEHGVPK